MSMINDALKRAKDAQEKTRGTVPGPELRPIEPLPAGDKQFGDQQVLCRQNSCRHLVNHRRNRMFDPGVVYHDRGIAHTRDEVDKESIPVNLEKPDGIANLAVETFLAEQFQSSLCILCSQEQVKVFSVAADSRMRP